MAGRVSWMIHLVVVGGHGDVLIVWCFVNGGVTLRMCREIFIVYVRYSIIYICKIDEVGSIMRTGCLLIC